MIDDYSGKDFLNLTFDVYHLKAKDDIFQRFPILVPYQSFHAELPASIDRALAFKYIVLAFDRNTPLAHLNDPMKIRNYAAQIAGFKIYSTGKFDHQVEEMLYSKLEEINFMIIQYCVIAETDDFVTLLAFIEALRKENTLLMNTNDNDTADRAKIIANINKLRNEIKALKKSLIKDERDTLLNKSLYIFAESENLGLSPESYAKKLNISKARIHSNT